LESSAQLATVVPVAQVAAAEGQTALTSQEQLPDPPEVVQLSFVSVQGPAFPHAPAGEHVSIWVLEHCVAPGLHATHPPDRQTGRPPEHGVVEASYRQP
jgi:hypothetical protein